MKRIAIVSAMDEETEYIHEYLQGRAGWSKIQENHYKHESKDISIYVKVLGVGKVNAAYNTADVINEFNPDFIVNIGVSGGLAPNAKRGTVAIGKSYVQTDFHPYISDNNPVINDTEDWIVSGLEESAKENNFDYITGRLATGDFFLSDVVERKNIIEKYNPVSFDMETAAIAQVASAKNIDFAALRIFSDLANDESITIIENKKANNIDEKEKEIDKKLKIRPTELLVPFLEKVG